MGKSWHGGMNRRQGNHMFIHTQESKERELEVGRGFSSLHILKVSSHKTLQIHNLSKQHYLAVDQVFICMSLWGDICHSNHHTTQPQRGWGWGCESGKAKSQESLELCCFVCFALRRSQGDLRLYHAQEWVCKSCLLASLLFLSVSNKLACQTNALQKNQLSDAKRIC